MAINKKYYYLKFKENYFDQDHIKVIEAMKNGYEYSLIILKLYLKAVKFDGQLKINEAIPYHKDKIDLLAGVIGHDPANVGLAINLAKDLGVIEILDSGEIFMKDIQNFIGHSSTEADRKKQYRQKLKGELVLSKNKDGQKVDKCPDIRTPEIEIEIDKEIEIERKKRFTKPTIEQIEEYKQQRQQQKSISFNSNQFFDYYESKGWMIGKNKMKDWKAAFRTWESKEYNKGNENKGFYEKEQERVAKLLEERRKRKGGLK
jgi:predicted phage replisome organizer